MKSIKLSPWTDPLNSKKTRNSKNCDPFEYNCGGFATKTFSWLCPYDDERDFERQDVIESMLDEGFSESEVADYIVDYDIDFLLNMFEGKMRRATPKEVQNLVEGLIAYRIASRDIDEDKGEFHFRVVENHEWLEKLGACEVDKIPTETSFEDAWDYDCLRYDSKIEYLIMAK